MQTFNKLNILEIPILNVFMFEALALIKKHLQQKQKTTIFFVNADCLNKTFQDLQYKKILQNNELNFADGSGVKLAAKISGMQVKDNINGTDMFPHLCKIAERYGYRMYLLGAAPTVAEKMKTNLQQKYPNLQICGCRDGYFDKEKDEETVIQEINQTQPEILLVAMGAPLQEKWLTKNIDRLQIIVGMGVGGLFDFYSGRIPRAPYLMRMLGFEWIFRLIQEPKRMWKRYILGNPLFIIRVLRWKWGRKKRGF